MKFPADAPVTAKKLDALRERIARLGVDIALIEESFIRSSGPGGQKANKTSSGVALAYAVSLPLLWLTLAWGVVASYLYLRSLPLERLSEFLHGVEKKQS